MPVMNRQVVSIPFTQGVDTKTDSYIAPKPSLVFNRVFRGGTLQRRYGTQKLPATGAGATGESVFAYQGELCRMQANTLQTWASSRQQWVTKATGLYNASSSVKPLVQNAVGQGAGTHAYNNGISVSAWLTTAGLCATVIDEATGAVFQNGDTAIVGTTGIDSPMALAVGGVAIHVYFKVTSTGVIKAAIFDTTAPATAPTVVTIASNAQTATAGLIDAVSLGGQGIVIYLSSTANTLFGAHVNADGTAATQTLTAAFSLTATHCVRVGTSSVGDLYAMVYDGTAVKFAGWTGGNFALAPAPANVTIESGYGDGETIDFSMGANATGGVTAFISSIIGNLRVQSVVLTPSGFSALTTLNGTFNLSPLSHAILFQGGVCAAFVYNSINQAQFSVVVIDQAGTQVAAFLPSQAFNLYQAGGSFPTLPQPRPAVIGNATTFLALNQEVFQAIGGSGVNTSPLGLVRLSLTPEPANALPKTQLGETLYVGGAQPHAFDGQRLYVTGFPIYPESNGGSPVTFGGSGSGSLGVGTYSWMLLLAWTNAQGEIVRSAPSVAATAVNATTGGVNASLIFRNARMTLDKPGAQFELYRTVLNGTNFYRVNAIGSAYVDGTTQTVSFTDNIADASLLGDPLEYTTGGLEDDIAPPGYSISCAHQNRLIIAGLENPYQWQSSSQAINGEQLRFNPDWGGQVPASTGPIAGLGSIDGNLIIFTRDTAYLVTGTGPGLDGSNSWPDPQLITAMDGGPTSPIICSSGGGVFFQNARGWMILDRSLNVQYVGADIEAYGNLEVKAATLRPEAEQIWIQADDGSDLAGQLLPGLATSPGGFCLVYDLHYNQWSVLTNYGAQDACYFNGQYTRVRSDGAVIYEVPGTFSDSGAYYTTTTVTAWLRPDQIIQGYERIWRAALLGVYGSDCTVTWEAAYDYQPTYNPLDAVTETGQGVFVPGTPFQIRRHMRIQKCQAVRFRITDSSLSGTGQGIGLTSLDLEFGGYGRMALLPAAQSR